MNLQHFLARHTEIPEQQKFFLTDQFPLDDEQIADTAINAMLLVMNNSTRPAANLKMTRIEDYAPLVASGIRFPWKDRVALSNCIDTLNDELPRFAAIGLTRREKYFRPGGRVLNGEFQVAAQVRKSCAAWR